VLEAGCLAPTWYNTAMTIMSIVLQKFRTYGKNTISFSPATTLFLGPNAIGKTNIIEAITMLSLGKSFRAYRDNDVVQWGNEVARVRAEVNQSTNAPINTNNLENTILELVVTTGMVNGQKTPVKKFLVNNVSRRLVDFAGIIKTVLFAPSDLELVTDSPSIRREYLNTVLVQTDREYRRNLLSYERGLRQRNSLLDRINEGTASRSQLLFWNQLLIKAGSYITDTREKFIQYVNAYTFEDLAYRLVYDPSRISQERLDQYANEEVAAKSTLVGPQRDDFSFEKLEGPTSLKLRGVNERFVNIARFGSRGEQRLAVLWLKLAEIEFIEKQTGERPILLLDDIFSELDVVSRAIVLDVINKQQTILTSAEVDVQDLFKNKKDISIIQLPFKK
jgi:DNA replication and repair protein RecF